MRPKWLLDLANDLSNDSKYHCLTRGELDALVEWLTLSANRDVMKAELRRDYGTVITISIRDTTA